MPTKKLIIGLGFQARAGKDTVAEYLVKNYSFKRYAFADRLKAVTATLLGVDTLDDDFKTNTFEVGQFNSLTGGQLLQHIGVSMRGIDENIWVNIVRNQIDLDPAPLIVIPDCRFVNEGAMIMEMGGVRLRIRRPGIANDTHVSEQEGNKINWDYTIYNDGTLDVLNWRVDCFLGELASRGLYTPVGAVDTPAPPPAPASQT